MQSVVDETFNVHVTTVRKGLVHLDNSSEGFDASGHNMSCCTCSMLVMLPLGVGRQALHSPSPSTISSTAMRTSEEEGLHFRPSSSHRAYALDDASSCSTRYFGWYPSRNLPE